MTTATPARHGLSLVELVMLMAIVGVLAAVAGPRYANSLALYRAQAAAQRVAADLNLARARARTSSLGQTVVFDVAANRYQLPGVAPLAGAAGVTPYTVTLASEPYAATLVTAGFAAATVRFDRYGQPAAGGTVTRAVGRVRQERRRRRRHRPGGVQ